MIHRNLFSLIRYFTKNLVILLGIVLIWRGVWYLLDGVDIWLFGGSHFITSGGGIILGLMILFIPDGDLKEISKI